MMMWESHSVKSALQENSAAKVSAGAVLLPLGIAFKQWLSPHILLEPHSSCDAAMPFLATCIVDLGCTGDLQVCPGGLTWRCGLTLGFGLAPAAPISAALIPAPMFHFPYKAACPYGSLSVGIS